MNKNYIPTNTNDVEATDYLKTLPFESVRSDISVLLEWLQDGHWDVAQEIAGYLVPYINQITKELAHILNSNDGMWKYYVIVSLIARSKEKLEPDLVEMLKRIAENPSRIDAEDNVDEVAKEVLANHFDNFIK